MPPGTSITKWIELHNDWRRVEGEVIGESLVTLYINGLELATIMATPQDLNYLAIGFLKNEGLITKKSEIEILHVNKTGCCVDIWLNQPFIKPKRMIITSGCGGGITFVDPSIGIRPLTNNLQIDPKFLYESFRKLQPPNSLYARSRGVHAAGLLSPISEDLLAVIEDVGRHNTVDKLTGYCLENGIETKGNILIVTGRTSSEMIRKAAVMGCPITASRTSPTSLSIEMAQTWNITLIGYVRSGKMRVYSHPERIRSIEFLGKNKHTNRD